MLLEILNYLDEHILLLVSIVAFLIFISIKKSLDKIRQDKCKDCDPLIRCQRDIKSLQNQCTQNMRMTKFLQKNILDILTHISELTKEIGK